jgi:hypothetical protein
MFIVLDMRKKNELLALGILAQANEGMNQEAGGLK